MEEYFLQEIKNLKDSNEKITKEIDKINNELQDCIFVQEKSLISLKHELQGVLRAQTKFIMILNNLWNKYQNEEFEQEF